MDGLDQTGILLLGAPRASVSKTLLTTNLGVYFVLAPLDGLSVPAKNSLGSTGTALQEGTQASTSCPLLHIFLLPLAGIFYSANFLRVNLPTLEYWAECPHGAARLRRAKSRALRHVATDETAIDETLEKHSLKP